MQLNQLHINVLNYITIRILIYDTALSKPSVWYVAKTMYCVMLYYEMACRIVSLNNCIVGYVYAPNMFVSFIIICNVFVY